MGFKEKICESKPVKEVKKIIKWWKDGRFTKFDKINFYSGIISIVIGIIILLHLVGADTVESQLSIDCKTIQEVPSAKKLGVSEQSLRVYLMKSIKDGDLRSAILEGDNKEVNSICNEEVMEAGSGGGGWIFFAFLIMILGGVSFGHLWIRYKKLEEEDVLARARALRAVAAEVEDLVDDVVDKVGGFFDGLGDKIKSKAKGKDDVSDKVDNVKDKVKDKVDDAKDKLEDQLKACVKSFKK